MTDASLCGLGQTAASAVLSAMQFWPELFLSRVNQDVSHAREEITLTIDGQTVSVPPGRPSCEAAASIRDAASPPSATTRPAPPTACAACAWWKWKAARILAASCVGQAAEGMKVHTHSERVVRARRTILEMLASTRRSERSRRKSRRMLDEYQADAQRFPEANGATLAVIDDNPMYIRDYCQMCAVLALRAGLRRRRPVHLSPSTSPGAALRPRLAPSLINRMPETTCVFCGQCVGVCPTGALKPKREWLLEQGLATDEILDLTRCERRKRRKHGGDRMIDPDRIVTTTCPYCGVGCNLQLHIKDDFILQSHLAF